MKRYKVSRPGETSQRPFFGPRPCTILRTKDMVDDHGRATGKKKHLIEVERDPSSTGPRWIKGWVNEEAIDWVDDDS